MIIFCDEENLFSLKLCQLSLSALSAAAAGQSESLALLQRRPLHPSLKIHMYLNFICRYSLIHYIYTKYQHIIGLIRFCSYSAWSGSTETSGHSPHLPSSSHSPGDHWKIHDMYPHFDNWTTSLSHPHSRENDYCCQAFAPLVRYPFLFSWFSYLPSFASTAVLVSNCWEYLNNIKY